MEQESRNRRRRSVRNLRRSSGCYTDSFTPLFEVDDLKADSRDVKLVSTYGSIWLEDENLMEETDPLVTCISERTRHVENQSIAYKNHCEQQAVIPSSHPSCEFSEGSFCTGDSLSDHQSLLGGSSGVQCVANMMGTGLVDVTSLSFYDSGCDSALRLQCPNQSKVNLDVDMNCGGESCPQTTHVPSTHSNNLRRNINAADAQFVQENLNLSHDDKVCDFKNKRLHRNVCHDESILEEDTLFSNEVVKTVFTDEVIRNVLAEKLPGSESVNGSCNDLTAVSLKERRKDGRLNERPDAVKDSDCKPKKRKRLSLKKIPPDSADFVHNDVNRDVETNSDTKISIVVENENNISETVKKVNNTHNLNTDNMNSTCPSEWIDGSKWSEKLELINCTDHVVSKEIDFEKDFFFQDFQVSVFEQKSKRSSQAKAKAARRSSRLFSACEMPLNDLSLEQNTELNLTPSWISQNELYNCEVNSSVSVMCSPEVSARRDRFSESKENVPAIKVCTIGKVRELEEEHSMKYLMSAGIDKLSVKDSTSVEEVVEDLANLCMNEETLTGSSPSVHVLRQTTCSNGSTVLSGTVDITLTNIYSCTSTDGNTCGIQNLHSHVDTCNPCNNLLDTSTLQENIPSDGEMSFNSVKFAAVYEEENSDTMEDQQSTLDIAFSTPFSNPSGDVDMEELLSPDKKCAEQETYASVISESGKCMRLRRGRKSWDTNQQLNPDAIKKPARRKSKQSNVEEQTIKLVGSDKPTTSVDAATTEQPDNDSEENVISPGLLRLYQNKNFVAPQPRSWETIRESPKSGQLPLTKQRYKCFLEFESGNTYAKQQRRKKKALNVYRKIGGPAPTISTKEFDQKMLDVQLFIDS